MMLATQTVKSDHLTEIVKCGRDPIHFIKTHVYIQHPQRGRIKFDTFKFQDDCVTAFEEKRFNVVLKSRQLGLSTICAAYALWLAIFSRNKNILIIATKLGTAQNFTKKIKFALKNLPKWLLLPTYQHNQREIRFSNGSCITAIPTSEDAGRSEALSLLIVDEAAFIKNFDEIWTGLYPTISRGGRAIVLSTPNGVGGQYHKIWVQAEAKQSDFNPIKLPWQVHPEQDDAWFAKETRGLSKRQIAQEYECSFLSSGDTFLQAEIIESLRTSIAMGTRDPRDKDVLIWLRPEADKKYVIGCDVARGDGHDFSAFHVLQADTMSVAAEYKGKCKPDKLAVTLDRVGREYGTALIAVENNSIGYATCSKLLELEYPRLYYEHATGREAFDYRPLRADETPGITTTSKNRDKMLAKLEELIRNGALHVFSERLYKEFLTFVWKGDRAESASDANDDLVMSLAIAAWVTELVFGAATAKSSGIVAAMARAMSLNKLSAAAPVSALLSRRPHRPVIDDVSWLLR